MARWSFGAKLAFYLAALVVLSFIDVLFTRATGLTTATFVTGWIMCSIFHAMNREAA